MPHRSVSGVELLDVHECEAQPRGQSSHVGRPSTRQPVLPREGIADGGFDAGGRIESWQMLAVLGIDLHQEGVKLVAEAPSIDEQRVPLTAQKVEDGRVVIGVYCRQVWRFLADEERHRACVQPIGLIALLRATTPQRGPTAVDLVDGLTRRYEMLG